MYACCGAAVRVDAKTIAFAVGFPAANAIETGMISQSFRIAAVCWDDVNIGVSGDCRRESDLRSVR